MNQTLNNIRNSVLIPYHYIKGFLAANHYDYPASAMTVIGVTGTNGKTSTCFMIYNVLKEAGYKVGLMSTIGNAMSDGELKSKGGHMTTADPKTLNKQIAEMRDAGVHFLVLEVSSHALAQSRVFGISFDIAVMTNVTPEHLDYHRTFERYRAAKMKLFKMTADNAKRGGDGVGIVNADDPSAKYFENLVPKPMTYGIKHGGLKATQVKTSTSGVEYYVRIDKKPWHIKVNIPGEFYVYNSLAAVAVCHALHVDQATVEKGIADVVGVPGRMQKVETGHGFDVIVDYAHTPDSYARMLPGIKKAAKGKVMIICGAAGKRDNSKFPEMGKLAYENSDLVILTEEDPQGPVRPLSELVAKGIRKAGGKEKEDFIFIDDRQKAINEAVKRANKGDVIMLLGMGHQKTIDRASGQAPWSEVKAVKKAIAKRFDKDKSAKDDDNEDKESKAEPAAKKTAIKKTTKKSRRKQR